MGSELPNIGQRPGHQDKAGLDSPRAESSCDDADTVGPISAPPHPRERRIKKSSRNKPPKHAGDVDSAKNADAAGAYGPG